MYGTGNIVLVFDVAQRVTVCAAAFYDALAQVVGNVFIAEAGEDGEMDACFCQRVFHPFPMRFRGDEMAIRDF